MAIIKPQQQQQQNKHKTTSVGKDVETLEPL